MSARDTAFEALCAQIGQSYAPARWIMVDQDMIDQFGAVTQDEQFIHTDPARAAQSPLGGTIAHGFLTLSLASRFAYDVFEDLPGQRMGINYGFDRVRFLTPVRPGQRVRGCFTLQDVTRRAEDGLLRRMTLQIDIDGVETPALVADWLALIVFD